MEPTSVAFLGVMFASLLRLVIPAYLKRKDDSGFVFNQQYTMAMILNVITAMVVAMTIFQEFLIPVEITSLVALFVTAFIYAWGQCDLIYSSLIDWWKE